MRLNKLSKIHPVPPNTARSTRRSSVKTSWLDINERRKREEAENAASNFLGDLLNDVDTIATGVIVSEKSSSSCSVMPLPSPEIVVVEDHHDEDRRLVNWKRWLKIRERDGKKIAKATLRHRQELLLNLNPNDWRKILKRKEIFEKSVHHAGDINFWKMPIKSRQGLFVTSPKFQKSCQQPEIVYTQTPDALLNEQKLNKSDDKTTIKVLKMIDEGNKLQLKQKEKKFEPRMEKLALTRRELQIDDDTPSDKPQCPVRKIIL